MTADDAFEKLMHRNALSIPVANPSAEARRATGVRPVPVARGTTARRQADADDEVMKVLNVMEEGRGDYNPRREAGEEDEGVFTTPTETDLDPVADDVDVTNAYVHGARVIGRDATGHEDFYGDSGEADEEGYVDAAVRGGEADGDTGPFGLDLARRVRRLAFLPLADMELFENRARDLMASLQGQDAEHPSLAVTCPHRGDGGTEIAIRLALAMAKRVDYRVLLADFDLRKPQVAPRLGLSVKHFALADVLRGSCPLGEALFYSEEDNLYVLPARASERDGDEFLDDRAVQNLFTRLHRTFDFAVVVCGPMDHADAGSICRHAGAAALAGYCGFTRAGALRDAADRLAEGGAKVAGLLLTGA